MTVPLTSSNAVAKGPETRSAIPRAERFTTIINCEDVVLEAKINRFSRPSVQHFETCPQRLHCVSQPGISIIWMPVRFAFVKAEVLKAAHPTK